MGHILFEEPELIKYVIGFCLLVGSIPFWGDIANFLCCKKTKSSKTKPN